MEEIPLGPFDLLRPVARGGMAQVWLARHRGQGVLVAIKILTAEDALRVEFEKRFADEVRAVAALDHPGVVMVLDHGRLPAQTAAGHGGLVAGSPWLAMEHASGGTLAHTRGPLPWPLLKTILLALLDALAHAHAHGVVHRDLKPANVLVASGGDARPGIKLSDFGIAWAAGIEPDGDRIVGTPAYMAPEQIRGEWRDLGPWTDLYALGCLVWWLCTGHAPYGSDEDATGVMVAHLRRPLPVFVPRTLVPGGFDAWLRRLLAKPMTDRFQCAADAAAALACLVDPVGGEAEEELELLEVDPALEATLLSTDVGSGASWRLAIDRAPRSGSPRSPRPELAGSGAGGSEPGSRAIGAEAHRWIAPIPEDWRRPVVKAPPMQLVGAGLSLYGLRTVRLAGREEERDLLWSELKAVARAGRARLVLLRGPAGTGKSRLGEWLCRRGHELGALTWCRATFSPHKAPGEALRQMISAYVGTAGLDRRGIEERVAAFLERHGCHDAAEAQVLTKLLCPATEDERARGGPVRLIHPRECYLGTANVCYRASQDRPLVVWLEDVQWGLHGLGLALEVLRSQAERPFPCLLLLTVRDEALEEGSGESRRLSRLLSTEGVTAIEVGPLPPGDHRQLVRGLLGLDDVLAVRVEERTAGNPLFAVQLVGSWVQDGTLEVSAGGFRLKPGARAVLPDDLHAVWSGQLQRVLSEFSEAASRYLEVAACLGMEVDHGEWGRACDDPEGIFVGRLQSDDALRGALSERLLDRRLVVGTRRRWSFVHGMLRESLQRTAQEGGRWRGHHESCAAMLRSRAAQPTVAERYGRHLLEAGHTERALGPLLRGVEHRLVTVGAQPAQSLIVLVAGAMARTATPVSDPRWGRLWILKARVYAELDEVDRALQEVRRARAAAERPRWGLVGRTALLEEAKLLLRQRALPEAEALFERLRRSAEAQGDAGRQGAALAGMARVAWRRGALVRAAALQDAALEAFAAAEAAEQPGSWRIEHADTWVQRGRSAEVQGAPSEATVLYRRALEAYEALGSGLGTAECLDRMGRLAFDIGALGEAEDRLSRALSRYEALGGARALPCRMRLARAVLRR
ncbi:MAG TPA: serine/threonine-protein kinase PknK, partial [Deltaproteobacteria bacterium]|nr:serine/threonine-protein kinase PknK [Deltaproteobacteria bacterium]